MGAAENRAKNAKMASDLVARGIFHGKRLTKSLAPNPLSPGFLSQVGSAAYRKMTPEQRRKQCW
ncbi:hypothetical protein HOT82_gp074 [Gordonia phage Ronaldo]|uniref:Uncharacterized protein n=4 Tax=Ronaldovirus TaxID=2733205 RepID=A0A6B9L8X2_9CAUD|nr:hypothetical protein HOT81_gp070 [Gordonia phage Fryberger]YP_009807770.1 hypothetical protein HOT82_gp074 [Gordonia phage Ronaldo]QDH48413.1 hypothetical protein SEA_ZIKO_74 [Gordonia phage Ziko]QHB38190.1 hypothetical protein SEA_VOLT_74 [Gordonia phage Volt]QTF81862.1 hypothetical protein SEA_GUEY18_77 [Gordonia phage Guey18]AXN53488.1 hypothetical protein SEA_FRYBERGER_70 [Gordonia phage Fryberger]AXN53636.1 hypothetical protein SEA_RONALDO_74 [Gordonia phage Ronaldo]